MEKNPPVINPIAFDNAFGQIARELDPYTEGAMVGVMATLISAYSGYLGPGVRVQTGRGTSPLSAWFVLVGISGKGRKGATARISMPVINKAFKSWASSNVLNGIPATGLGMIGELTERDGDPVFVLEEEMDTFITNAKKDTKVGVYLRKAWDGEPIVHKTAKAHLEVESPHLGFVGHVQPKNWGAISGSKDATGGTYNRFLALFVEQSKRVPVFSGPDPTDTIEAMARRLRGMAAWGREVDVVTVPQHVAEKFEEHHRPVCEGLTDGNEALSEMAERAMAYMVRLAALYALGEKREEITVEDFDSALELVRYSVESVRYVLPETGGSSIAQKILVALELDPEKTLTASELWDAVGRNTPKEAIQEALRQLPQVESFKGPSTGGRPPIMFRLVQETADDDDELELIS